MEPASAIAAAPHVVKVLEYIDKRLADIANTTPDDASYYIGYIDIASAAVQGLYDECLGIILQATRTPPDDAPQVAALLARMKEYFYGERLRPRLHGALERLGVGQGALQHHASARLVFPSVRARRQQALAEYELLLSSLQGFLDSLGNWEGRSGAALGDLEPLYEAFKQADPNAQVQAEDVLLAFSRNRLAQITAEAARTIERVRLSFR